MVKSEREEPEFTEIFEQFLKAYSEFSEISEIARRNTYDMGRSDEARIWIIGGFVYRPIIRALYGEIPEPSQIDIDFLIERPPASENLYLPEGWTPSVTRAGYPYLDKGKIRIDLNYLSSFHSIIARQLSPPSLEHFFTGTPMNIQSIAYDLTDKTVGVIGKHGIFAIKNKIVQINNLEEAIFESEKRGMRLEDYVREKAEELGFSWDITSIQQIPDINKNHKENGKTTVKE